MFHGILEDSMNIMNSGDKEILSFHLSSSVLFLEFKKFVTNYFLFSSSILHAFLHSSCSSSSDSKDSKKSSLDMNLEHHHACVSPLNPLISYIQSAVLIRCQWDRDKEQQRKRSKWEIQTKIHLTSRKLVPLHCLHFKMKRGIHCQWYFFEEDLHHYNSVNSSCPCKWREKLYVSLC